jgi:putative colanic acid biosynthesis acetyltransferase WcaF
MEKRVHYTAADLATPDSAADPYLRPAFSSANRARRLAWNICHALLYRTSPRPLHAWRSFLLRSFGATLGTNCRFYPRSRIWAPWNLVCGELVAVADGAEIYNPAPISLGSHAIVSQDAYLCGATHDFDDPAFPLLAYTMEIGANAWICARASVSPGVNVGEGAVLGLGSVATRNLEAWTVYGGIPALKIRERRHKSFPDL